MTKGVCAALILALVSCSDGDEEPPFACGLGELQGTWRVTYQEQGDGTCGPVSDLTLNFSSPDEGGCVYAMREISRDKCRLDFDFTCTFPDGKGKIRSVGVTRQPAVDELVGDLTIEAEHPELDYCRSTYKVTYRKLLARAAFGAAPCGDGQRQVERHAG